MDALVARLSAESEVEIAVFVTGSVEPASNVGPWLKDGTTWYVWDDVTGSYIPQILEQASLGYIVGSTEPDHTVYQFWIQTSVGGQPQALKTYYSGAWTDVYATSLGTYMTVAAFNAAIAAYSTTSQMNTAIAAALATYATTAAMNSAISASAASTLASANAYTDAAIAGIPGATPAQSARAGIGSTQTVPVDGSFHKVNFDTEAFDINANYNAGASQYVAPFNGIYQVSAELQVDNNGGTASAMEIGIRVVGGTGLDDGVSVASPPGSRWYPDTSGLVQCTAGDTIEVQVSANDGVNAGNIDVSNGTFSINLVQAT